MWDRFDVIVIGGGHAGLEAAAAACRFGVKVALITMSRDNLGEMSCNPAIGGIGKGTIVREIDALDGIMARAIDRACINFKILNRSNGEAVWGWRGQADRKLYKQAVVDILQSDYNDLQIIEDTVVDILLAPNSNAVDGIKTKNGLHIKCGAMVLTSGTFLSGITHIGSVKNSAGRYGELPSIELSQRLKDLGLPMGRLKTGTPARLDGRTINFVGMEEQKSDEQIIPFSFLNQAIEVPQTSCFITYTNALTHQIILDNIDKAPMYNGAINSRGPRYCPSIEDKVKRFSHRERHQVFLEPEGLDNDTVYPNGISTSLPSEVQDQFIRTIPGLENVRIIRYGYAIEYDYLDPVNLYSTLQLKAFENLFFAGQINGTTGYEEAAGQGLVAGVNAAYKSQKLDRSFVLNRMESYIGVMIDDMTTVGVANEPYRMFTSRSEYRLSIRADNADLRLTELGIQSGIVGRARHDYFYAKKAAIEKLEAELSTITLSPNVILKQGIQVSCDGKKKTLLEFIRHKILTLEDIVRLGYQNIISGYKKEVLRCLEIQAKYWHYIKRQEQEINERNKSENTPISKDFDYTQVGSLSNEMLEKLNYVRPATIGAASRIPGVTPAAINAIIVYLHRYREK